MDEWSTVGTNTNVQEKLTCRHLLQLRTCVVFVKKLSYLRKRSGPYPDEEVSRQSARYLTAFARCGRSGFEN